MLVLCLPESPKKIAFDGNRHQIFKQAKPKPKMHQTLVPPFRSLGWRFNVVCLYRRVVRLHKTKLAAPQRRIGDAYVRNEFGLNRKANEKQANEFMREWTAYCDAIEGEDDVIYGRDMDPDVVEQLDDDMKQQLMKLKEEAEAYVESMRLERENPSRE